MVRFYQFYQTQDANIIDYELYPFDDIELRGPKTNHPNYIAYIGAAQTFGRYCKKPFPSIIGERLNIGTLNFGFGGMGPTYFLNNTAIMDTVNKAELVVVQVLSARSISNSIFQSTIGSSFGINMKDGRKMHSDKIFQELFNGKDKRGLDEKFMKNLIEETKQNYVSAMIDLLKAIQPPKVLFWFSVRTPQQCGEIYYRNSWLKKNIYRFDVIEKVAQSNKFIKRVLNRFDLLEPLGSLGEFPHMVNEEMIGKIRAFSDFYVECVTKTGLPQVLVDRQGKIVGKNGYYHSPEMHEQASELLYPVCKSILSSSTEK
jgi:hypothetical protein